MLYSHIPIHNTCISGNIMTTSMNERTHFFIKVYLSHFIRKSWCFLCLRSELESERDCHILTPSSSDHSSTSFAFWWAAQPWALRAEALCLELVLTPATYLQLELQLELQLPRTDCLELQLTQAVCSTWLYNYLSPTCFLWAYASAPNSTTSTGQGDIPTSSTGCTSFFCLLTLVHSGFTALSRANM